VPVMQYTIFGKLKCEGEKQSQCSLCRVDASALQATFLLNNNLYQFESADQWEQKVFISNIKTFNKLFDYNTDLTEGMEYNMTLYNTLVETKTRWETENKFKFIPMKIEYLAERSIPDNIELEGTQNAYIIVISYIMMFVYVSVSIGFFPSAVYNRFILGFAGIFVVISALIMAIGITFYAGIPLTMISAEVVPFLILAIGVDNMFLISRAERNIPEHVT
jgi:Niemann-Pick C1 protein